MMRRAKSVAKVLAFVALGAYGTAAIVWLELPALSVALLVAVGLFAAWRKPAVAAGAMLFAAGSIGGVVGVGFVALSAMAAYRWRSSLMSPNASTTSEAAAPLRYGLGMGNARELLASVATAVALAIVLLPVILDAEPNEVTRARDLPALDDLPNPGVAPTNELSAESTQEIVPALDVVRLVDRSVVQSLDGPSIASTRQLEAELAPTATESSPPWYVIVALVLVAAAVVYAVTRLRSVDSLEGAAPTDDSRLMADVVERFEELGRSLGAERPEHMGVRSFGRLLARETGDPRFMQLGDSISARLYGGSTDVEAVEQLLTEFEVDHSTPD